MTIAEAAVRYGKTRTTWIGYQAVDGVTGEQHHGTLDPSIVIPWGQPRHVLNPFLTQRYGHGAALPEAVTQPGGAQVADPDVDHDNYATVEEDLELPIPAALLAMGFPAGYVLTPQDINDLRFLRDFVAQVVAPLNAANTPAPAPLPQAPTPPAVSPRPTTNVAAARTPPAAVSQPTPLAVAAPAQSAYAHPWLSKVTYQDMIDAFAGRVAWPFRQSIEASGKQGEVLALWLHSLDGLGGQSPAFVSLQQKYSS